MKYVVGIMPYHLIFQAVGIHLHAPLINKTDARGNKVLCIVNRRNRFIRIGQICALLAQA